jgi:hypothetical protein
VNTKILQTETGTGHSRQGSMPKLQPSFSTSDLPTMRTGNTIQTNNNYGRGPIDRQRHTRDLSINAPTLAV